MVSMHTEKKQNFGVWVVGVLVTSVLAALVACLYAIPVWLLWNAVMPDVFGLKAISFLQALWLTLLAYLLFGRGSFSGK